MGQKAKMVRTDAGIVLVEGRAPRDIAEGDRVVRYRSPASVEQTVRAVRHVRKVRTSWGSTQYAVVFDGEDGSRRFSPNTKLLVVVEAS